MHPDSTTTAPSGLDATDLAIIALETKAWRYAGAKETAVRDQLGMSPTRYYQRVNALIDNPAALAHAPGPLQRLRRLREARRQQRRP